MSIISLGHDFNGGNASPPIAFKSLVLSSPISFPHKSRTSSRYNSTVAMSANEHCLFRMSLYSRRTTVYTSCHANNNKLHLPLHCSGGIEARPGTEKRCSHNLQSGPVKTRTAVFVIINISDRLSDRRSTYSK